MSQLSWAIATLSIGMIIWTIGFVLLVMKDKEQ